MNAGSLGPVSSILMIALAMTCAFTAHGTGLETSQRMRVVKTKR